MQVTIGNQLVDTLIGRYIDRIMEVIERTDTAVTASKLLIMLGLDKLTGLKQVMETLEFRMLTQDIEYGLTRTQHRTLLQDIALTVTALCLRCLVINIADRY